MKIIAGKGSREHQFFLMNSLLKYPIRVWENIYLRLSIRHIYGPKKIKYGKNEAVVTCLVHNGGRYIESFIKHYFSLGVKHIVFLDNGSEDNTVAKGVKYPNVTILSTKISLVSSKSQREIFFKNYLSAKFCKNRWCISVDIDEFFDYPFSGTVKLNSLLDYLNINRYTAVVTQMLDMFSDKALGELGEAGEADMKKEYRYYDISDIIKNDYYDKSYRGFPNKNILVNRDIKFHRGGIRRSVFGVDFWITKHALFFAGVVKLVHPHWVANARCADFSAILLHYKFTVSFLKNLHDYLESGYGFFAGYAAMLSRYKKNPALTFKGLRARKLESLKELIENDFLVVSNDYLTWSLKAGDNV